VPSDIATSTPDAGGANKGAMDDLRAPALVWTDAGGVLFYRRLDTAPYVNRERVFTRPVLAGTAPPPDDGGVDASEPVSDGGQATGGTGGQATGGTGGQATGGAAGQATGGAGGHTTGSAGGVAGGTAGQATSGAAGQATGGAAGQATSNGGQATGGAGGQSTGGAAGGATGGSDGAAVDAGKPVAASESGCRCAMGGESRSSLPWSLLLPALVLLRRRRGRRQTR
jgi:MYXO-CTERM domain-containing protein